MQFPAKVGPHIGRPNLYQGKSSGRRGSGFTGGSLKAPTRVVRNTLGWQSNYTVNYAYVVRRFRNSGDQALNVGQYCFLRKHRAPLGDDRLHTICNIVQLNSLLLQMAISGRNTKLYNSKEGGLCILNEWCGLGVVATEVGYNVLDESGADQPQERLINATIRGRVSTFNIWGKNGIVDGCPLWFILERKKIADVTSVQKRLILNGEYEKALVHAGTGDEDDDSNYCWQLRAWADWKKKIPDEEDVGGDYHLMYVGRVSSKGYMHTHGSAAHITAAHNDVDRLVTLPKIEIFCDIDTKLV